MKTISFKTFNLTSSLIIVLVLLSLLLASCEKKDAATSDATLRTKEVVLTGTTGSSVMGKAVIAENADHSFNVNITLQNTVKDTVMVMHIHNGSIASPGNISVPLTNIKGTGGAATGTTLNINSGMSSTGATMSFTYDSIVKPTRYINVHYSATQINNIIANGNIQ
ncbi:MAG: CHRD domain-containing protein [Ginsengibacter sp.]